MITGVCIRICVKGPHNDTQLLLTPVLSFSLIKFIRFSDRASFQGIRLMLIVHMKTN